VRGKEVQIDMLIADRMWTVDVELIMHDIISCKHLFIPHLSFKIMKWTYLKCIL
jgi:hypothetical protein